MQRQYTIELRVDFSDQDKNDVMKRAVQEAARHMYAKAELLSDGQKPRIALFADDFFHGHEEIAAMDDVVQQAIDVEKARRLGVPLAEDMRGVSNEMLDALNDDE